MKTEKEVEELLTNLEDIISRNEANYPNMSKTGKATTTRMINNLYAQKYLLLNILQR